MTDSSHGDLKGEFYFMWSTGTVTVGLSDGHSLVAEIKQVKGAGPWTLMLYNPYSKQDFASYEEAYDHYRSLA